MARAGNNHRGGRPKGKKNQATLDREEAFRIFRERAMRLADVLLDNQVTLARGQTFLYRIDKEKIGEGKKAWYKKLKPVLVTDEAEIREYLDGLIEEGDMDDERDPGASYYYLTAKEPNNQAIDSILDRTFGRATQSVKVTDPEGNTLPIVSLNVVPIEKTDK